MTAQQLDWKQAVQVEIPEDEEWDPEKYDWSSAGAQPEQPAQPLYKWSYDGHQLTIWPVDAIQGRPHHIEVTGLDFYKLAQGRVYRDNEGNLEILVWEDRGTEQMQDEAIEAVDAYLKKKLGKGAEYYSFQSEGGVYRNQEPGNENWDEMLTAYFGYPVKTNKPSLLDKIKGQEPSNPFLDQFRNKPAWDPTMTEGI